MIFEIALSWMTGESPIGFENNLESAPKPYQQKGDFKRES